MKYVLYSPGQYIRDNESDVPALRTTGCGCCSCWEPLTPELLEQAIAEAKEWLELLESLRGTA